jgi:DNA-binding response OmpR family regulator
MAQRETILIVDDEANIRRIISKKSKLEAMSLYVATRGVYAVAAIS